MSRKRSSRTYLKNGRYYADFRDYADVGGAKEALIGPGSRNATQDPAEAERLANAQLQEYIRRRDALGKIDDVRTLTRFGTYTEHHLAQKAGSSQVTTQWLESVELHLDTAKNFFGAKTSINKITVLQVSEYVAYLGTLPSGRRTPDGQEDGKLSPGTQRKYLDSLSNLFRRAISEGLLPAGSNPVTALFEKPSGESEEADWLEIDESALLLYAAKLYRPRREDLAIRCVYALVATLLLTGGRLSEVLGLEVDDINFERKTVVFRRSAHRRLKNRYSSRPVPLWPQLIEILREYLSGPDRPTAKLLFPSPIGEEGPIREIRRVLDELELRVGLGRALRSKMFRHTYCAARLQTTDRGASVALYTVSQELGHNSSAMVQKVYGHVSRLGSRGDAVEFRVNEFWAEDSARIAEVERVSRERNAFPPNLARRAPLAVEVAALKAAMESPETGSARVAEQLETQGLSISGSGVRWIWERHGLRRKEMRVDAIRSGRLKRVVAELQPGTAS